MKNTGQYTHRTMQYDNIKFTIPLPKPGMKKSRLRILKAFNTWISSRMAMYARMARWVMPKKKIVFMSASIYRFENNTFISSSGIKLTICNCDVYFWMIGRSACFFIGIIKLTSHNVGGAIQISLCKKSKEGCLCILPHITQFSLFSDPPKR